MAAVLQGAPVTATNASDVGSITFSATVAAGTNTVMAVCVGMENDGAGTLSVSSVTFNGDALTLLAGIDPSSYSRAEIWYRVAPDVATGNVVVTFSSFDKCAVGAYVADGVDQATPLRAATSSAAASGTSVSNTVAGVVTGDLVLDMLSIDAGGHAATVGADQTEQWDLDVSGATTGASSTQLGSAGGVMSWTWTTSQPWSHVATAFANAAAAPGGMRVNTLLLAGIGR